MHHLRFCHMLNTEYAVIALSKVDDNLKDTLIESKDKAFDANSKSYNHE
jgi:hypothetical protein